MYPDELSKLTDAQISEIVDDAELRSLLPALASLTGDVDLISDELQQSVEPVSVWERHTDKSPHEAAKTRAIAKICALRDASFNGDGSVPHENLDECIGFLTGSSDSDSLPLLRTELGVPESDDRNAEIAAPRRIRAVVTGAGVSGIAAAKSLRDAGVEVHVLERNRNSGGVWFENRYPGCRLDTSNFGYSFSFAPKKDWPDHYSTRGAVLDYLHGVVGEFDLDSLIEYEATVISTHWDSEKSQWITSYTRGTDGSICVISSDIFVSAVGQLNAPKIPSFEGQQSYQGVAVHTARYPEGLDLSGKRVAVIGTGASAYQVIPAIAEDVDSLTVFQRSAPWALPAANYHEALPDGLTWLLKNIPNYYRWYRLSQFWSSLEGMWKFARAEEGWAKSGSVSALNLELRNMLEVHIREQFADAPDLLPHVIPDYAPYSKRMLRDNGDWARTLKQDNVELVSDAIEAFTATGIQTKSGRTFDFDVVIYGTGFDASNFLSSFDVFGRNGLELHDFWNGEPRAYLGMLVPEFPNFFCLYGPNTNLVLNGSALQFTEFSLNFILDAVRLLQDGTYQQIECTPAAFSKFNSEVDAGNERMAWGQQGVDNWYKSASGRVSQNWPFSALEFWQMTRAVQTSDLV